MSVIKAIQLIKEANESVTFQVSKLLDEAIVELVKSESGGIHFSFEDDFAEAFTDAGIDPTTVTDEEWRAFEKMFMSGTHWDEVAEVAASTIADQRNNAA